LSFGDIFLIIPANKTHRIAWIKYELGKKNLTLADVARSEQVSRQAASRALHAPYPRMEKAIADALGRSASDIWPERYQEEKLNA
jgi:Ner family transcriptional regulator